MTLTIFRTLRIWSVRTHLADRVSYVWMGSFIIRYMIYLAQTCRMITQGGYYKSNVKGSGQIPDAAPATMWRQAGCDDIYPGYDVDNTTVVDSVQYCEEKDGRVIGVGARDQKTTSSVGDCIDWCKETQWCVAYSWAKAGAALDDALQCYLRDNDTGEKDQPGRISGRWVFVPVPVICLALLVLVVPLLLRLVFPTVACCMDGLWMWRSWRDSFDGRLVQVRARREWLARQVPSRQQE